MSQVYYYRGRGGVGVGSKVYRDAKSGKPTPTTEARRHGETQRRQDKGKTPRHLTAENAESAEKARRYCTLDVGRGSEREAMRVYAGSFSVGHGARSEEHTSE